MKTLTNPKATVSGTKVTVEFDLVDKQFDPRVVQQVTATHVATKNHRHYRHIQISHEAFFVKRPGTPHGLAIDQDALVDLATAIVPQLSYAPVFREHKASPDKVQVTFDSELNPQLQWQSSPDLHIFRKEGSLTIADPAIWTDIVGANDSVLDLTKTPVQKGYFVRCVASSEAGQTISNPPVKV